MDCFGFTVLNSTMRSGSGYGMYRFCVALTMLKTAVFGPPVTRTGVTGDLAIVDDGSENPTLGCDTLVNPDEVEYVKEKRPEFLDRISELKSITIESDPSITPGGCFMETAFGSVDARLETQLEKIAKAVERAFEIDD